MIAKLLLDRKREGRELAEGEIRDFVAAYMRGEVPDYQMSAFAMAVCCRGMTTAETAALTAALRESGTNLSWDGFPPTADKHSTGGVGDKLSLIVQPLAAACGLAVPSLVGRGLGLTGGTADKMESIPGYNASLSLADFRAVVADCGCSLTTQTPEIAPADGRLYALRDVTGTVPSIPLIVASILSKKLAEGAQTLVFDVKCGAGAFMRTRADADALAQALVAGARAAGRRAHALVTDMSEPLGFAVGNANEVREALDVLNNRAGAPQTVVALSLTLAAHMVAGATGVPLAEAVAQCRAHLANGDAARRFARMVERHGGDLAAFEAFCARPCAARDVVADATGVVTAIDAEKVARAAFVLGAGRAAAGEAIDMRAGVMLAVAHGDRVAAGAPLARVETATRPETLAEAAALTRAAISIVS